MHVRGDGCRPPQMMGFHEELLSCIEQAKLLVAKGSKVAG
jgi:hypothetical protein